MKNRGDMTCFHEPYNEAFYYGEDRRHDRYFAANPGLQVTPGLTMASVHHKLLALANQEKVFIKDFAYSIMHMADDEFLDVFHHTFLIRDPQKVITSMHSRWPDITLAEIGFEELHTLFKRLSRRYGTDPVIIDSDDLLQSPEAGMKAYCDAADIPFIAEALNWEQDDQNPTWNQDDHGFHDALKNSTGLQPQKRSYPLLETSADMQRLYEVCKPHYDALYDKRLIFETS